MRPGTYTMHAHRYFIQIDDMHKIICDYLLVILSGDGEIKQDQVRSKQHQPNFSQNQNYLGCKDF